MTLRQRTREVLIGLGMLVLAILLIALDEKAYPLIVAIYSIALELRGFRQIWYYLTMARHMVGGRNILYRGILLIDAGVFTGSLIQVPQIYILIYLTGTLAFAAAVDLLRAREAKGIHGPWKFKTGQGLVELGIALICLIFLHTQSLVVDIFSVGFIISAFMRIAGAFRRSPVITIS